ncbi:MAG: hypothetical protein AAGC54_03570 [Cyanobacteria bacterium P01_F01_bin.4]
MKEPFSDSQIAADSLAKSACGAKPEVDLTQQPEPFPTNHLLRVMAMILTATGLACLWVLLFALPARG